MGSSVHIPTAAVNWSISTSWRRLDELCIGVFDCPHSTPILTESGPYVARSQDIRSGILQLADAAHVSTATYRQRIVRAEPVAGDLLYSREGAYHGIAAEVPAGVQVCLGQRMVLIRPKLELLDFRFLRYWLNSPIMARHIEGYREGSAAERLNLPAIRELPIPIIELKTQTAIAEILSSIDKTIALNVSINSKLEAITHSVYKDWFLDFGPTQAKLAGEPSYLSDEIWDLFPDTFNDKQLPATWRPATLGDFASSIGRVVKPTEVDPSTPYIALDHMPRKSIALSSWDRSDKAASGKVAFRKGDILFGKLRPYFHKVGVAPVDGICSTDIVVLGVDDKSHWGYVLGCVSDDTFIDFVHRTSDGTKMPRTSWGKMSQYPVAVPHPTILKAYSDTVQSIADLIISNVAQNRTLTELRDLLIPKLMSREITVCEAQETCEVMLD